MDGMDETGFLDDHVTRKVASLLVDVMTRNGSHKLWYYENGADKERKLL